MGKIVMPKNSALLNEIEAVLKIYYEEDGWLANDIYKARLMSIIGEDQYQSSYTKKAQITSYFGFTIWEDFSNRQSRKKITQEGKKFYIALKNSDTDQVLECLMNSLEKVKFGRDNCGCTESNSDIEPPSVFIRAILDLGYLTYKEFAYLLWKLEDCGGNYSDALLEVKESREKNSLQIPEAAQKYTDAKPIMTLIRWGFLAEGDSVFGSKKIIISPVVLNKYKKRLSNLKIYNIDMDNEWQEIVDEDNIPDFNEKRLTGGTNILLYGVPGSGKSHIIKSQYCNESSKMERVVFHPDYTYSDFIGQILPRAKDDKISYEFTPGPFTKILSKAQHDQDNAYFLIIEEINRGNAPAIFGEVFQLLDRTNDKDIKGTSEYGISNSDIAKIVYDGDENMLVKIPSNLYIIATMNTSDQNVFTLDTAFQRRWNMRLIENDITRAEHALVKILDTNVTWKEFSETINNKVLENNVGLSSSEDKRLGAYFVTVDDLIFNKLEDDNETQLDIRKRAKIENSRFPEKVIKYLWDDAFKFSRESIFAQQFHSLEEIIKTFEEKRGQDRFSIFKQGLFEQSE